MAYKVPAMRNTQKWAQFAAWTHKAIHTSWDKARGTCLTIWKALVYLAWGADKEEEKVVLQGTWRRAFLKCSIHIWPVGGTISLIYFNASAYFVGVDLSGLTSAAAQGMDRLLLQVAAKVLELLVIASLATIIMDVVREGLLSGSEGVPIGLVLAQARFVDISYLLTRDFRAGCLGFKRPRSRWLSALFVILCSTIALFAGPSAALLSIPTFYSAWPAGGASFWLNGGLTPTRLDASSVKDPKCLAFHRNTTVLETFDWQYASCPWAGYPFLSNFFSQPFTNEQRNVSYDYGTFQHNIDVVVTQSPCDDAYLDTVRVWAVAGNTAVAAFSGFLASWGWCIAQYLAPQVQPWHSKANLRYAGLAAASVKGQVPVVRTQCFIIENWTHGVPAEVDDIPLAPNERIVPFPIIPDFDGTRDGRYFLPVERRNVSRTSTEWIPIPTGSSVTGWGFSINEYPSAFLLIRKPRLLFIESDIACSVQADWVPGTQVTKSACNDLQQQAVLSDEDLAHLGHWGWTPWCYGTDTPTFDKPPTWQQVVLDTDWLKILTPRVNLNVHGETTLASTIATALSQECSEPPVDCIEGSFDDVESLIGFVITKINAIVATFVVDGLTRIGWNENFVHDLTTESVGNDSSTGPSWIYNGVDASSPRLWSEYVSGSASLLPDTAFRQSVGSTYDVAFTVQGFGLRLNGVAYYLALTIFLMHLLLVLAHVGYTLWRKRTSGSWSSLTDILVLSQKSTPRGDALKNTCAGIDAGQTLKRQMRIREIDGEVAGHESLQLLVDSEDGYKVRERHAYGASV